MGGGGLGGKRNKNEHVKANTSFFILKMDTNIIFRKGRREIARKNIHPDQTLKNGEMIRKRSFLVCFSVSVKDWHIYI